MATGDWSFDIYNTNNGNDCMWPTNIRGGGITKCDFNLSFDKVYQLESSGKSLNLVIIPEGTILYHATFIGPKEEEWFYSNYASNTSSGMVWFASTSKHASMINHTHLLTYKVKKDLVLVFEHNLRSEYGGRGRETITGMTYIPIINSYKLELDIDGYVGCNECEIGLFNSSVKNKIVMEPTNVINKSLKFID